MHSRSTTIIGAGVAVAILGAVLVFAFSRHVQGTAGASTSPSTAAYVATAAIGTGTKGSDITPMIKLANVPTSARPADAVTALSQISSLQTVRSIEAGEVISASQFGAPGTPNTSTNGLVIPAGHNAITVTSPVPQAVAGYVSPGDLVNVYMISKDSQGVRLLLSNVSVLATVVANTPKPAAGAAAPPSGDIYFTLSLTPQEAEKVVFAETYEGIWYGLVHPGDGPVTTNGQSLKTLFQ